MKCRSFKIVVANYVWTFSLTLTFVYVSLEVESPYSWICIWFSHIDHFHTFINFFYLNVGNYDIFVSLLLTLKNLKTLHQCFCSWPETFCWEWLLWHVDKIFSKKNFCQLMGIYIFTFVYLVIISVLILASNIFIQICFYVEKLLSKVFLYIYIAFVSFQKSWSLYLRFSDYFRWIVVN